MSSRTAVLCFVFVLGGYGCSNHTSPPGEADAGDAMVGMVEQNDPDASGSQNHAEPDTESVTHDASGNPRNDASSGANASSGGNEASGDGGGGDDTGGADGPEGNASGADGGNREGGDPKQDSDGADGGAGGAGNDGGVSPDSGADDASSDAGTPFISASCRGCMVELCGSACSACGTDSNCVDCLDVGPITPACAASTGFAAVAASICDGFCAQSCVELCQ